jgi:hypothetical protein
MATKGDSFNLLGLDFQEAKTSLKQFLTSQSTLKDYNFDGSVLNTILDVLAYNTHYQAFYANMVANESFLDTASLRQSVVSHAKALGYVPSSIRASKAIVDIPAPAASDNTYLSRGTEFVGTDGDGLQYRFVLLDTVYANGADDEFQNVSIHEGSLRRVSYIYDTTRKNGYLLTIPNDKADVSTLKVRVQVSPTDTTGSTDVWTYSTSYIDLTPTSKVFFLQEKGSGIYELFFGDNFLGLKPADGSLVTIEYLETNGEIANGISTFTCQVTGLGTISTVSASSGGAAPETISRIKFLAPKYYQSQSRAVTEDDYTAKVFKEYPNTDSVVVYGGENVTPPQYGKVFIAIKPKTGLALTTEEKKSLVTTLRRNSSVITVTPEIVDPDYIEVVFDSLITYDPYITTLTPGTIKALIVSYIFNYSSTVMERFGSNLYLSKVSQGINGLDNSILSNQTTIMLRKSVNLSKLVQSKGVSIEFRNPLYHPHDGHSSVISSSAFSHIGDDGSVYESVTVEDDGNSTLNLVVLESNGDVRVVLRGIGTVDYETGSVRFNTNFKPISQNIFFVVTAQPSNKDIFVFENNILRVSRAYSDSVKVSLITQETRKQSLRGNNVGN